MGIRVEVTAACLAESTDGVDVDGVVDDRQFAGIERDGRHLLHRHPGLLHSFGSRLQPGGALGVVDPRVVVESARMSHMQQLHLRTLSHVRSELRTKGDWPGVVRLRRGWAAAQARPWNDQTVELASLRLERGGDRFLGACVQWLGERGVRRVLSPAMPDDQSSPWRRAGFENHLELVVFEKDLRMPPSPPLHRVTVDSSPDAAALAVIDDRAFDPVWRIGQAGLADAMAATPNSVVLVVEVAGVTVGFVIVGEMAGVSYLQRLAVHPDHARRGIGRSLVRASVDWARRHGARTMVLNTQPENTAAARLYEDEGFVRLGARLRVLAREGS